MFKHFVKSYPEPCLRDINSSCFAQSHFTHQTTRSQLYNKRSTYSFQLIGATSCSSRVDIIPVHSISRASWRFHVHPLEGRTHRHVLPPSVDTSSKLEQLWYSVLMFTPWERNSNWIMGFSYWEVGTLCLHYKNESILCREIIPSHLNHMKHKMYSVGRI